MCAVIVSILVVGFMLYQSHVLTEQFSIQNRPWMSIVSENNVTVNGGKFDVTFKNYGKSVAHDVKTSYLVQENKITEDEIIKSGKPFLNISDYSPDESVTFFIPIPEKLRSSIWTEDAYIGLILNYNFEENKKGKSLLVIHWTPLSDSFVYDIKKIE